MSFSSACSDSARYTNTYAYTKTNTTPNQPKQPSKNAFALELFILSAVSNIKHISWPGLSRAVSPQTMHLGDGAVSSVRLHMLRGRLVAVKYPRDVVRSLKTNLDAFDEYIHHVLSEVRVLANDRIRGHANILTLYGYSVGNYLGAQASLVYEYSRWGSLDAFLAANAPVPPTVKVGLCRAVTSGLHALYSNLTAKICDFSQAIIGDRSNLNASLVCGLGTPLFSAPELLGRNCWNGRLSAACTIEAALAADVYSFGLLAWQVLADGRNYCQVYLESKNAAPGDTVESVLTCVPRSTLFHVVRGILDAEISRLPIRAREMFNIITAATLEDSPSDRRSAEWILAKIDHTIANEGWWETLLKAPDVVPNSLLTDNVRSILSHSIFEPYVLKSQIMDIFMWRSEEMETQFPENVKEKMVEELTWVVEQADHKN
ncbi:kinase-like domain-containing protein [Aspergillus insuetus]